MNPVSRIALAAAFVAVAASSVVSCRTSPSARFYTLSPEAASPVASLAGRGIAVGPVELPPYLDRPQMVIRGEQGEIILQEFQRWAEPLDSAFLRVLTQDLIITAGTQQVVAVPISRNLSKDYQVMARVSRFDVDQIGNVMLIVQWYVSDDARAVIIAPRQSTYTRKIPLPLNTDASIQALSETIADFAADIARTLAASR